MVNEVPLVVNEFWPIDIYVDNEFQLTRKAYIAHTKNTKAGLYYLNKGTLRYMKKV